MDTPWRIEMLGWLRAVQGERIVSRFRTRKTGALLAYLAFHLHRSQPRELLIELLWPEATPELGRNSLSKALTSLRHQLEPPGVPAGAVILADRDTVRLNPAAVITDVGQFEGALHSADRAREAGECCRWLIEAAEQYTGELLPGFFDDWILQERERLAEANLSTLARLVSGLRESGDLAAALSWARRAVAADPLREEAHDDLIRLLIDLGQPDAARRQYAELERLLAGLGAEPEPEIRALVRGQAKGMKHGGTKTRRGSGESTEKLSLAESSSPHFPDSVSPCLRVSSQSESIGNLPLTFTRFFGRESEMASLLEMLGGGDTRLLTLTGPGGSGKTRLAIEVAARLRKDGFQDGPATIWFAPLQGLTDASLIPDKLVDALRLPRSTEVVPLEQVIAALSQQPSLLLLDNFEHLVEGGAPLIRALLERVEGLTVLVTSRRCLNLEGEREFPVGPLPVPVVSATTPPMPVLTTDHCSLTTVPSVALFVDRAQAVRSDFQVTERNAAAVGDLCAQLEGLPLALELAASRARMLTASQMLERLEERFKLLVGRQRSADPRHRSLRATLDWSYQLLTPELQRFFVQLSVFRGGWTLEAAEAVCEEPRALEYLEELQQCSLVVAEAAGEEMRYRLLETMREYGVEQLSSEEQSALAQRHLGYYLAWTEEIGPEFGVRLRVVPRWADHAEREMDNLRAALDWMVRSTAAQDWLLKIGDGKDARVAGPFLTLLVNFWKERGYQTEGRRWLAEILDMPGASFLTIPRGWLLHEAGALARQQGDFAAADALVQESLEIVQELGKREGELWCCGLLALVARDRGDYERVRAYFDQTTIIARERGEAGDIAFALYGKGYTAYLEGDLVTAQTLLEQGLQMARSLRGEAEKGVNGEARESIAWIYAHLGEVADARGDYPAAQAHLDESLAIMREFRSLGGPAHVQHKLGRLAQHQGRWNDAAAHFFESLAIWRQIGNKHGILECLEGLGAVAGGLGEPERAARLLGAAAALRKSRIVPVPPVERADLERAITAARARLSEAAFVATWAQGQAIPIEQAVAEALQAVPVG